MIGWICTAPWETPKEENSVGVVAAAVVVAVDGGSAQPVAKHTDELKRVMGVGVLVVVVEVFSNFVPGHFHD